MKYRGFEVFIAGILSIICYFGNYYLQEHLTESVINHIFKWHVLRLLWLILMFGFGYWGLFGHECKWVKKFWITGNAIFLIMLFANKLADDFWHCYILPDAISALIRTPFVFLIVVFLPRWFTRYETLNER